MTELILKLYGYMKGHRLLGALSFIVVTGLLALSVSRLDYKEDIADFLPIGNDYHNALKVYQDISGANKVFAVFQYRDTTKADPDIMVGGIDAFVESVQQADTAHVLTSVISQIDFEQLTGVTDFVYNNIPYFLSDRDYARIDSVLRRPDYVRTQMHQDKEMLMFPAGGLLSDNIQRDPMNLFTPVVQKLQKSEGELKYEMYDGHIFSPDMQKAFVVLESPYGSSETENNSRLTDMLSRCGKKTTDQYPNLEVHIIGGPVIAVTNAKQIKTDSIISVTISVTLILALLLFSFRNVRNLLLIALSIAWGWLFAMGGLALLHDKVSVIVIGISSVILGIAVNYPLHFIAHLSHTPDKRKALHEIVMPLLVGNVTTVGAFLALVPLQSVALRDLGLFSSFLLIGTILFVLVYLPHLAKEAKEAKHTIIDKLSNLSLENKPVFVVAIVVLTIVLGYFSLQTRFDTNMGHINYMTEEQKADMAYFQRTMVRGGENQTVYAISSDSTQDGALDKSLRLQPFLDAAVEDGTVCGYSSCNQFVVSRAEQMRRLKMWHDFVASHRDFLKRAMQSCMQYEGFADDSFDEFFAILDNDYSAHDISYFSPLTRTVFASNFSNDSVNGLHNVVNVLSVKEKDVKKVEKTLKDHACYSFDVASMNSAIADHLSDDFNYIGYACSFIVFFFLWLSMGSIELAILSFVPMAVSWLWILGIMALFGMQFNIVNIILATFIFGQGDDYTIFMTEGAMYEYAYRRKMLASYKHSIIISALIMFIGIGTLIVARHPALHSLAEVTVAGMFSVVLMAYVFPPLIFNFLVKSRGVYRKRPIVLKRVVLKFFCVSVLVVQMGFLYLVGIVLKWLMRPSVKRDMCMRRLLKRISLFDMKHLPYVKYRTKGITGNTFCPSMIIVCNHQSVLDFFLLFAQNDRLVVISDDIDGVCPLLRTIFRWGGSLSVKEANALNRKQLQDYKNNDCSFVLLSMRNVDFAADSVHFPSEVSCFAAKFDMAVMPVIIHGSGDVWMDAGLQMFPGAITIAAYPRLMEGGSKTDYSECSLAISGFYQAELLRLAHEIRSADYYREQLLDCYRYKGAEIYNSVRKRLKRFDSFAKWIDNAENASDVVVLNENYGEFALLYAFVHQKSNVIVLEPDGTKKDLISHCGEGIIRNVTVVDHLDAELYGSKNVRVYSFDSSKKTVSAFPESAVVIVS